MTLFQQIKLTKQFPLKNLFKLIKRSIYFIAIVVSIEWVLNNFFDKNYIEEEENKDFYNPKTIETLIKEQNLQMSNIQIGQQNNWKIEENNEWLFFTYEKAKCNLLILVKGEINRFRICHPPKITWKFIEKFSPIIELFTQNDISNAFIGNLAYFINGQRDNLFEKNLKVLMGNRSKLRVYTKYNSTIKTFFVPDTIENIQVKAYTENKLDLINGNKIIGIKDLIDSRDDYHRIEFIKFEMKYKVDPIIFSINIPIFAAHILLKIEKFSYEEFRYLIKRMANSLYFPYFIEKDKKFNLIFISFIHKYSMFKYHFSELRPAKWTLAEHI